MRSKTEVPGAASGSRSARSRRAAIANPTAMEMPAPSGPVVASMPAVWPTSGCPGVSDPSVRRDARSSTSSPYPARNSWVYCVSDEWPADRTKRSRPTHRGSAGSPFITFW